jgi:hypothetical protein
MNTVSVMRTYVLSLLVICGLLVFPRPAVFAIESSPTPAPAPAFSPGVNEVLKLVRSGMEESVVLAYIKTALGPFQLGADEIIQLHDSGISSSVITAMLNRAAELRRPPPALTPTPYPNYGQPPDGSTEQPATGYTESSSTMPESSVTYVGSPYPVYSYPYYISYGYYPYGYWWPYYPYRYPYYHYPYYYYPAPAHYRYHYHYSPYHPWHDTVAAYHGAVTPHFAAGMHFSGAHPNPFMRVASGGMHLGAMSRGGAHSGGGFGHR